MVFLRDRVDGEAALGSRARDAAQEAAQGSKKGLSFEANFEVVEAREDRQLVVAAAEPLGGPEFRKNGVLAPWHNL